MINTAITEKNVIIPICIRKLIAEKDKTFIVYLLIVCTSNNLLNRRTDGAFAKLTRKSFCCASISKEPPDKNQRINVAQNGNTRQVNDIKIFRKFLYFLKLILTVKFQKLRNQA